MTRGRPLSQDLRWSLLKMARTHDINTISRLTGVGKRTVERLMSDYRKYGTAARWGPLRSLKGRKRKLSTRNVEFLRGYIRFRNDPYAIERNEGDRLDYRFDYGRTCEPECTVFVDESSFDRRTVIRNRGWALRGKRAERKCFFCAGKEIFTASGPDNERGDLCQGR
ncbi:hypothetical protein C8R44DRAFT_27169 [Mycena epipterygia]|nr:hypothetical protein C8R44DRAFT_27169 [Mycena epipterygia]